MPYPYVPSGGIIQQAIDQFKKALPPKVDAATLKKLGVAPSNEGYVINTLKFLGLVDAENARTDAGVALFTTHGDAFGPALEGVVREKYDALFELRADEAWGLDRDALISFFRTTDKTSATVGAHQALTFSALASMAGKREASARVTAPSAAKPRATAKPKAPKATTETLNLLRRWKRRVRPATSPLQCASKSTYLRTVLRLPTTTFSRASAPIF